MGINEIRHEIENIIINNVNLDNNFKARLLEILFLEAKREEELPELKKGDFSQIQDGDTLFNKFVELQNEVSEYADKTLFPYLVEMSNNQFCNLIASYIESIDSNKAQVVVSQRAQLEKLQREHLERLKAEKMAYDEQQRAHARQIALAYKAVHENRSVQLIEQRHSKMQEVTIKPAAIKP